MPDNTTTPAVSAATPLPTPGKQLPITAFTNQADYFTYIQQTMSAVLANKYAYTEFWTRNTWGVPFFDIPAACYAFGFIWFKGHSFEEQQKNVPLYLENNASFQWQQAVKKAITTDTIPADLPWANMQNMTIDSQANPQLNLDVVNLYFTLLSNSTLNTSLTGSNVAYVDIDGADVTLTGNNSTIIALSYTALTGTITLTNCTFGQNKNGDGINDNNQASLNYFIIESCYLYNLSFNGNNFIQVNISNSVISNVSFANADIASLRIVDSAAPVNLSLFGITNKKQVIGTPATNFFDNSQNIINLTQVDLSYAALLMSPSIVPRLILTGASLVGTTIYNASQFSPAPMTGTAIRDFFIANGMSPDMANSIIFVAPSNDKQEQKDVAVTPVVESKSGVKQEETTAVTHSTASMFAPKGKTETSSSEKAEESVKGKDKHDEPKKDDDENQDNNTHPGAGK